MIQMISGFLGNFSFDQIMQIVPTIVGLAFFGSAVNTLRIVVTAIGAGIGIWGIINLLEGYGQDNSGAKSQGIKQLMAGGGVVIIAQTLIPLLANMFD